ncbi:hypothetical protein [Vibrio hepatarius]|uniref:hypothetical protein n=1 Tax=Vibrio hepatarius TaxID=171383 RepID=UPI003734F744
MKTKVLALIAMSLAIAGCGGGSSDEEASKNVTYLQDGIYLNDTDLTVMFIDTEQVNGALIVGDFANNSVYFTHTSTIEGDTLKSKGVTHAFNGGLTVYSDLEVLTTFTEQGADLSAVINNQNLIYSFDKVPSNGELSTLVGTHTNPNDGSTWSINNDGSFVINGICTLSGTMHKVKFYYVAKNVQAVNCADSSFNASDYEARVVSVEQAGNTYILGLLAGNNGIIWGYVPL